MHHEPYYPHSRNGTESLLHHGTKVRSELTIYYNAVK
jgi:hypothetical protein